MNIQINYYKNKRQLDKILAIIKVDGLNFFDYLKVCDSLQYCVLPRFMLNLYNECLYLNSVYIDHFNHSNKPLTNQLLIAKEIHTRIHEGL